LFLVHSLREGKEVGSPRTKETRMETKMGPRGKKNNLHRVPTPTGTFCGSLGKTKKKKGKIQTQTPLKNYTIKNRWAHLLKI